MSRQRTQRHLPKTLQELLTAIGFTTYVHLLSLQGKPPKPTLESSAVLPQVPLLATRAFAE